MIAFLLKQWQAVALVALLTFGVVQWKLHDRAKVREGVALERARIADSALAVLKPALGRTDTLLRTQIKTVTQTIARVDTLRDSIFSRIHDSVFVTRFIERADEERASCLLLSTTCKAYRDTATATIAALEAKVKAIPFVAPRSCTATGATWGLVGATVGLVVGRKH